MLSQNVIRDAGAVAMAKMLRINKSLKVLNMRANHIGREGYELLCGALETNQTLEKVLLEFNQIPEEGGAEA